MSSLVLVGDEGLAVELAGLECLTSPRSADGETDVVLGGVPRAAAPSSNPQDDIFSVKLLTGVSSLAGLFSIVSSLHST